MILAVFIDMTFILFGATVVLLWQASKVMGNETTAKIYRIQLLIAIQYIICHAENLVSEAWRFKNFP